MCRGEEKWGGMKLKKIMRILLILFSVFVVMGLSIYGRVHTQTEEVSGIDYVQNASALTPWQMFTFLNNRASYERLARELSLYADDSSTGRVTVFFLDSFADSDKKNVTDSKGDEKSVCSHDVEGAYICVSGSKIYKGNSALLYHHVIRNRQLCRDMVMRSYLRDCFSLSSSSIDASLVMVSQSNGVGSDDNDGSEIIYAWDAEGTKAPGVSIAYERRKHSWFLPY